MHSEKKAKARHNQNQKSTENKLSSQVNGDWAS